MSNSLRPLAIWLGTKSIVGNNVPRIAALDRWIHRRTGQRMSLVSMAGLPSLLLTVPGVKSGVRRTTPLLCTPYRNGALVAGSNWGHEKQPAWVGNLAAAARRGSPIEVRLGQNDASLERPRTPRRRI